MGEEDYLWTEERRREVVETLMKESDRGCAIFGAAILHDDLGRLLREFFRKDPRSVKQVIDPLFEAYRPLASFQARIDLAYSLALIRRSTFDKLHVVRKLRNEFAHESGLIDFDDERCRDRLRLLIAEGKPKSARPEDSEIVDFGGHNLPKHQVINRVAFVIAISENSASIRFLEGQLKRGRDVRLALLRQEEQDHDERETDN